MQGPGKVAPFKNHAKNQWWGDVCFLFSWEMPPYAQRASFGIFLARAPSQIQNAHITRGSSMMDWQKRVRN